MLAGVKTLMLAAMPIATLGLQVRETPASFPLYAFGEEHPGLPVFYANGRAFIGDFTKSSYDDASMIHFSPGADDSWIGTLVGQDTDDESTNKTFTLPGNLSLDKQIRLPAETSLLNLVDDGTKTGFTFYGSTALHINDQGEPETLFTALKIDDAVAALYWNDTSLGQEPVSLRRLAPSEAGN